MLSHDSSHDLYGVFFWVFFDDEAAVDGIFMHFRFQLTKLGAFDPTPEVLKVRGHEGKIDTAPWGPQITRFETYRRAMEKSRGPQRPKRQRLMEMMRCDFLCPVPRLSFWF